MPIRKRQAKSKHPNIKKNSASFKLHCWWLDKGGVMKEVKILTKLRKKISQRWCVERSFKFNTWWNIAEHFWKEMKNMTPYTTAIICVTAFVCLGNILAVIMLALYSSIKHWDSYKFYIWKIIWYVFECLCLIWNPLIFVLYVSFH